MAAIGQGDNHQLHVFLEQWRGRLFPAETKFPYELDLGSDNDETKTEAQSSLGMDLWTVEELVCGFRLHPRYEGFREALRNALYGSSALSGGQQAEEWPQNVQDAVKVIKRACARDVESLSADGVVLASNANGPLQDVELSAADQTQAVDDSIRTLVDETTVEVGLALRVVYRAILSVSAARISPANGLTIAVTPRRQTEDIHDPTATMHGWIFEQLAHRLLSGELDILSLPEPVAMITISLDHNQNTAVIRIYQITMLRHNEGARKSYTHIRNIMQHVRNHLESRSSQGHDSEEPRRKKAKATVNATVEYVLVCPSNLERPSWKMSKGWNEDRERNNHQGKVSCLRVLLEAGGFHCIFFVLISHCRYAVASQIFRA
ncbi:hypothetical protein C8Q80DRAFT_1121002 [Daedaleopsis nitida]|nr:hypothetical protein C8Q80DRAFT_1121002 [Daedaleopsis nitida]